jgi:hypothetical protein
MEVVGGFPPPPPHFWVVMDGFRFLSCHGGGGGWFQPVHVVLVGGYFIFPVIGSRPRAWSFYHVTPAPCFPAKIFI